MVLEQLYTIDLLRKKPILAFLLGLGYTVFATFFALLVFPQDPALVIVGITTILLIPSLHKFTLIEEEAEREAKSLWDVLKNNWHFYRVYIMIFKGSFIVFAFFSAFLPGLATNHLFKQQVSILTGGAFNIALFSELFMNNMQVLLLCFAIAVIAGNAAIFMIIWNASVWGTIFGVIAKSAAINLAASAPIMLVLVLLSVLPHVIIEISSYILAVIPGTIISRALVGEKIFSSQFRRILVLNLGLLVIAILVLVIGAGVESYVLENFSTYQKIIQLSFGI